MLWVLHQNIFANDSNRQSHFDMKRSDGSIFFNRKTCTKRQLFAKKSKSNEKICSCSWISACEIDRTFFPCSRWGGSRAQQPKEISKHLRLSAISNSFSGSTPRREQGYLIQCSSTFFLWCTRHVLTNSCTLLALKVTRGEKAIWKSSCKETVTLQYYVKHTTICLVWQVCDAPLWTLSWWCIPRIFWCTLVCTVRTGWRPLM